MAALITASATVQATQSFEAVLAQAAQRPSRFGCASDAPDHACALSPGMSQTEGSFGDALAKIVLVRRGTAYLTGGHGDWSVTRGHMVFVPAGRAYVFSILSDLEAIVVHLRQSSVAWVHDGCWVAPVSPLAAAMTGYAVRWGPDRAADDATANAFFAAIAGICPEWFSGKRILWTPAARSTELHQAVSFAYANLVSASIETAADAAGVSVRTLRRRFHEELGLSWRDFMREARMNRAIELLSGGQMNVTETAFAVGFSSVGAFTVAFSAYAGLSPSTFASRRVRQARRPRSNQAHQCGDPVRVPGTRDRE